MEAIRLATYEEQFTLVEQYAKGAVRQHFKVNKNVEDYLLVRCIATEKAKRGSVVDIMPALDKIDPLREVIYPDAKRFKNPDLRIDGVLWEIEQPTKPKKLNNLKHRISDGAEQADHVLINLIEWAGNGYITRVCKGRFIDHKSLMAVEFRFNGKYRIVRRLDFE